jgi:hypothetical protein
MRLARSAMLGGAAGAALGAMALPPGAAGQQGGIVCSVFSHHPCLPTVCSPFSRHPCQPQYPFPLGETLQLTVNSTQSDQGETVDPDHKIDTIHDMFVALRACWLPPDEKEAHAGTQMSVRFAFNRAGGIISKPRVTYATPGIDRDTRKLYRDAITDALDRCTPMPFTRGMGGAIAGQPIAIRYVDNRTQAQEHHP